MNNRLVITCGSPGSASAWIPQIVSKIFQQNSIAISNEARLYKILKDDIYIKHGYKIGTIPNVNPVFGHPTKISLQAISRNPNVDISKRTASFKNIEISKKDLVENTSLIYSHASPGYFLGPKLDEEADVIFFTYRDLLDQSASMLRLFGLTSGQLQEILKGQIPEDLTLTLHTNPKNFLVTVEESMDGFYNKYFYLMQLREAGFGYLLCKQKAKCFVHAFDFKSLTITKELESIEKITKVLNLKADSRKILDELNELKSPGKSCYRNAKKKKVNIVEEYFSRKMVKRLKEFFGDVMCIYGSWDLNEYSEFLHENESVNVLRVCPRYSQEQDNELRVLSYLRKINEVIDFESMGDFERFDFESYKPYVIFVFDKLTYKKTADLIKNVNSHINFEIYPLHRSLYGYKDYVYDLKSREKIDILDIYKSTKKVLIVYDRNSINLNYIFDYLKENLEDIAVYGDINESAKKTLDEKNISHYAKVSDIPKKLYDTVLINSQEARCVYVLVRRLGKKHKHVKVFSYHPLFEYERPTLERMIEKSKKVLSSC